MTIAVNTRVRVKSDYHTSSMRDKTGTLVEYRYGSAVVAFDERFALTTPDSWDTNDDVEDVRPDGHTGSIWYVDPSGVEEIGSDEITVGSLVKVTCDRADYSYYLAGDKGRVLRIVEEYDGKRCYLTPVTLIDRAARSVPTTDYVTVSSLELVDESGTMTHDEVRDLVRKWQTKHDACAVVDQALRDMGIDPHPAPQVVEKATVVRVARELGGRNGMSAQVEEGLREAGLDDGPKPGEFGEGDTVHEVGYSDFKYKVYMIDGDMFIRRIEADDSLRDTMYKITDLDRTQYVKVV